MARGPRALLLLGALVACACSAPHDPREKPNVLLVTLDTTRADHLGVYGYPRDTSPHLDALAREGVVYERALSTSSWTLPAHASLFTGKHVSAHGARYDPEGPLRLATEIEGPADWQAYRARGLHPSEQTLAKLLAARGYATGAVVAGPWMKRPFGLAAGFDHYDDSGIDAVNGRRAAAVSRAAIDWIDRHRDEPWLLFLNYYDAHTPYDPPEEYEGLFRTPEAAGDEDVLAVALYDAEIRAADEAMGAVFAHLRERALWEPTLVVVTADHGELLGEHGLWGHALGLSEPELAIPLVVKHPFAEVPPGRESARVQLTDVLPLLAGRLQLELPPDIQGTPPGEPHPMVAEIYPIFLSSPMGDWRSLHEDRFKFVWNSQGRHRLFDLERDPGEERNLVGRAPALARAMAGRLEQALHSLPPPPDAGPERDVDPQTQEALKGLGYLE